MLKNHSKQTRKNTDGSLLVRMGYTFVTVTNHPQISVTENINYFSPSDSSPEQSVIHVMTKDSCCFNPVALPCQPIASTVDSEEGAREPEKSCKCSLPPLRRNTHDS